MSPGSPIPSESQLQHAFGVSRVTIRRAISELVTDGVLVSRQGMGHFIADPARVDMQCVRSFTEDAFRAGHVPTTRLLSFETAQATGAVATELDVDEGQPVIHVKRLRLLDGEPTFVSDAYLAAQHAGDLGQGAFEQSGAAQSLYHVLRSIPGLQVMEGSETTTAVVADSEASHIFGVTEGSPLVQKACTLLNQSGEAILFERATWGVPITSAVKAPPMKQLL